MTGVVWHGMAGDASACCSLVGIILQQGGRRGAPDAASASMSRQAGQGAGGAGERNLGERNLGALEAGERDAREGICLAMVREWLVCAERGGHLACLAPSLAQMRQALEQLEQRSCCAGSELGGGATRAADCHTHREEAALEDTLAALEVETKDGIGDEGGSGCAGASERLCWVGWRVPEGDGWAWMCEGE